MFFIRILQSVKRDEDTPFLLGVMFLAFTEVSIVAQLRLWSLSGEVFDLFRMAQAIWSVTQGQWLVYTNHGQNISRLLEHVEVIYFAFVPLLAWVKDASILLLLQAAFLALGIIPVYRLGQRHGGIGRWLVGIYLFYPVVQTAFLLGFHADTFAAVFLLWALDAMERRQWRGFWGWVILALISKIYMVVPVFFLAVALFVRGERRRALGLSGLAFFWFLIAFWGFKWLLAPLYATTPSEQIRDYVQFRYDWQHWGKFLVATLRSRLLTLSVLILPVIWWLPKGKMWVLMWLGLTLPALVSTRDTYDFYFHHYVVGVPFLLRAIAENFPLARPSRLQRLGKIWTNVAIAGLFIGSVLFPCCVYVGRVTPATVRRGWHLVHWLRSQIREQEPLLASYEILPFFALRPWLLPTPSTTSLEVASGAQAGVIDLMDTPYWDTWVDRRVCQALITTGHWQVVDGYDGVFVIRPQARADSPLLLKVQPIETLPAFCQEPTTAVDMGNGILLRCVLIQPTDRSGRVQVRIVWQRSGNDPLQDGVAITRIGDTVPMGERWLHLPVWLLYPTLEWKSEEMVLEEMTWTLHLKPGCYPLWTQWWVFRADPERYPALVPWGREMFLGVFWISSEGEVRWQRQCNAGGEQNGFTP